MMRANDWLRIGTLGVAMLVAGACADDTTVSDDDDDDGGSASSTTGGAGGRSGTSSNSSSTSSAGSVSSSSAGTSASSSTSTGMGDPCLDACTTIYNCGVDQNRCPGFSVITLNDFNLGTMNDGCIANCGANPLLVNLVNPNDCDATVNNLKAASVDFATACDGAPQ